MRIAAEQKQPSLISVFTDWLMIGIQSFGGGSSTFFLVHQACIEKGWLSEDEFLRDWALAQVSPGINLIKLTVIIGYQLRGWAGLVAAEAGLLLPSGLATILMTAGYALIRNSPLIQAVMKGILPATIGLSLAMAIQMAQPLFSRARREGLARLAIHTAILIGAALLMVVGLSPVLVLAIAGAATILAFALTPAPMVDQTGDEEAG